MKEMRRGFAKRAQTLGLIARGIALCCLLIAVMGFGPVKNEVAACQTCLYPDPGSGICVACGDFGDWGGNAFWECWPIQEICACLTWDQCKIAD